MNEPTERVGGVPRGWRWLVWAVYLAGWTTSLETTEPVALGAAVLSPPALFTTAKVLHVSAYAVLSVLTGWLRVRLPYRWLLLALLSAHAMGTEYFQQFVRYRHPSWRDVGLDHLGIALGIALSWKWWRLPP